MATEILMPALSPSMTTGKITRWLKARGDAVQPGDALAEIETDKATMEVEADEAGVLGDILVADGTENVAIGAPIAMLLREGEAAQPAKRAAAPAVVGVAALAQTGRTTKRLFASPLARRMASRSGLKLADIAGSGPRGRIVRADVEAVLSSSPASADVISLAAPSPVAEPHQPRVVNFDAIPKSSRTTPAARPPAPAIAPSGSADQVKALFEPGSFEEAPHDTVRRTISRRLTEAQQTIPQFYLTVDCEIDALLRLREEINKASPVSTNGKPAWKVSVNDMAIKALALALMRVPDANVTWTEAAMLKHKHADVGVAVALPDNGLITPIIRAAETKSLSQIALAMKDFGVRAKERRLRPHEYQGGTTAVSNLGMFGIKDFTAVINPPHATMLAIGAGEQRPVVRSGKLGVATLMSVTLSCDHRAIDGALGARLIGAFKELIENPMAMLV